jgi:hypothetical protein
MALRSPFVQAIAFAGVVAVTSALVGCAESSSPAPTPSSSTSTVEPAPPETETPAAAAKLVIAADSLTMLDTASNVMFSVDYRTLTGDVVALLTEQLGAPEETALAGGNHNGEGKKYSWDGFSLTAEDRWATLPDAEMPTWEPRWWVTATAPAARGVVVEAVDGIKVGDDTQQVIDRYPDDSEHMVPGSGLPRVDIFIGAVAIPIREEEFAGGPDELWRVWLFDEDPQDVIQEIRAPSPNYGA